MKFGLSSSEMLLLEAHLLKPLKEAGAQIWIFGSRARGDHKKYSDIDVLYQMPKGKNLSLAQLSKLKEALEESTLPYKVDIVNILDVAESYRDNILKEKIEIGC